MLNSLFSFREFLLSSHLPIVLPGEEPKWVRRNAEHARVLKELRADARSRRKDERNAVDRGERSWLARRLGFARD